MPLPRDAREHRLLSKLNGLVGSCHADPVTGTVC